MRFENFALVFTSLNCKETACLRESETLKPCG